MSRPLWPLAAVFAAGGVAALLARQGVYQSFAVGDNVVVVNRFTGDAFRVRDGLREPVLPATPELLLARHFEKQPAPPASPAAVPAPVRELARVPPTDDDPFAGLRQNPDFKILSPPAQFDRMKRYAQYWLQPSQSARLPKTDREVVLDRMLRGLLAHPYAKTLSEKERDELRLYFRDLVDGKV